MEFLLVGINGLCAVVHEARTGIEIFGVDGNFSGGDVVVKKLVNNEMVTVDDEIDPKTLQKGKSRIFNGAGIYKVILAQKNISIRVVYN